LENYACHIDSFLWLAYALTYAELDEW